MRYAIRQDAFCTLLFMGMILAVWLPFVIAQDATTKKSQHMGYSDMEINPAMISTLDDIRELGAWRTDATIGFIELDASQKSISGPVFRDPS